jgi:hypothetical protein
LFSCKPCSAPRPSQSSVFVVITPRRHRSPPALGGCGGWRLRWLAAAVVGGGGGWRRRWLAAAVVGGGGGWPTARLLSRFFGAPITFGNRSPCRPFRLSRVKQSVSPAAGVIWRHRGRSLSPVPLRAHFYRALSAVRTLQVVPALRVVRNRCCARRLVYAFHFFLA